MRKNEEKQHAERLAPGTVIAGRYAVLREAGRGGMSIVYEAADLRLGGRRRAVKAMKPGTLAAGAGDAGIHELAVLQRIDHPRLPQIIDVIPAANGMPAMIVTDFVNGEPLAAAFERADRIMDVREAASIAVQLCEALAYLHELEPPIIHLDVKPSNVMLDPVLGVRLIDFGIARLLGFRGNIDELRLGTPGFAAPEQVRGAACGPAADLYAVGALLGYLLSGGHMPKPDERKFERIAAGVPDRLLDVLARLLSRDPAQRPVSARQTAALIRQAVWPQTTGSYSGFSIGPSSGRIAFAAGTALAAESGMPRSSRPPDDPQRPHLIPGTIPRWRPADDGPQPEWIRPRIIAAASLSRGAGATFLAAVIAGRLAEVRPTALVECPGLEPELFALLSDASASERMNGPSSPPPVTRRHLAWMAGPMLQVHALHPDTACGGNTDGIPPDFARADGVLTGDRRLDGIRECGSRTDEAADNDAQLLPLMAAERYRFPAADPAEPPLVVIDLSSGWMRSGMRRLAAACDVLLMTADPQVWRWTPSRMAAWRRLERERAAAGLPVCWIANQDMTFPQRKTWLSMMPGRPEAIVPLLPPEQWRSRVWSGEAAGQRGKRRAEPERSLQAVINRILGG